MSMPSGSSWPAALIADPGQWDQRDGFIGQLPLSDEQKQAFPDETDTGAIEAIAAMQSWLESEDGNPQLRWALLQRGLWANGQPDLFHLLADLDRYRLSDCADRIRCPTLLTQAEGDPIGAGASTLFDALTVDRKTLIRFTTNEGAGGHCEATARRLFHQRVFDWLDETLDGSGRTAQ
jgi:pimeloyl-ACP methyl ester carboxylesterase